MRLPLMPLLAVLALAVLLGLAGCGTGQPPTQAAIQSHSDAVGSVELATLRENQAHSAAAVADARARAATSDADRAKALRDKAAAEDAERAAGEAKLLAEAKQKAADDQLAQERAQAKIDADAAAQESAYRSSRSAIVVSAVLVVLSFRFPQISGLLQTFAMATSAAAYGFACSGWLRGHLWLVPASGGGLGLAALLHHLVGTDHAVRIDAAATGATTALARWLPSWADIKQHWHLPAVFGTIAGWFHRPPAATLVASSLLPATSPLADALAGKPSA